MQKALLTHVKPKHKQTLSELMKLHGVGSFEPLKNPTYNEGKAVYINKRGVEILISKSKLATASGIVEELVERLSLNLNLVHRTKEQEFIGAIRAVFAHVDNKTQFCIGVYRIDLYFIDLRIAVECDELGHSDRDPIKEQRRQKFIESQLNCTFFRFNPDCKNFNIYETLNKLLKHIESKQRLIAEQQKK